MLIRTDPFRELDRVAAQVLGTAARPSVMPMDAWRDGEGFVVEFDLPGVDPSSIDLDVERNVLTVRAERRPVAPGADLLAAERPRGVFSRQVILGEALDSARIRATYDAGVLHLTIPVAEQAKPRKITVEGVSTPAIGTDTAGASTVSADTVAEALGESEPVTA
jgi:HSP20 family protein